MIKMSEHFSLNVLHTFSLEVFHTYSSQFSTVKIYVENVLLNLKIYIFDNYKKDIIDYREKYIKNNVNTTPREIWMPIKIVRLHCFSWWKIYICF